MKKKQNQKLNNKLRVVTWVLIGILCIISILFATTIGRLGLLPTNYFVIICVVLFILFGILLGLSFLLRRKTPALITLEVISLLLIAVFLFGHFKIDEVVKFLNSNLNGTKTEIIEYSVLANIDYQYEKIDDINRAEFTMSENSEHKDLVELKVKELYKGTIKYNSNESELLEGLKENKDSLIIVKKPFYEAILENDESVKTYSKELTSFTIDVKIEEEEKSNKNISKQPFLLYIGGIDTRSNDMPMYCLTDSNILVAVNPKTKDILMVHIPRDYYVQLHGTTGMKDKLTHAGYQGGVKLSMSTIEDFMNVDIDHYIKVNFNALVKLVDAVGGITIYNELNHGFTTFNDSKCYIKPGNNDVNGRCALAFARERFAYSTGDIHRGENQQQVLEKLINKISSSKTLISNYSNILQALDGSFNTSLTQEDISSLVKMQLNNMTKWNITKYNITGTKSSGLTYSWPKEVTHIMLPDQSKLDEAKKLIDEVLNK